MCELSFTSLCLLLIVDLGFPNVSNDTVNFITVSIVKIMLHFFQYDHYSVIYDIYHWTQHKMTLCLLLM